MVALLAAASSVQDLGLNLTDTVRTKAAPVKENKGRPLVLSFGYGYCPL